MQLCPSESRVVVDTYHRVKVWLNDLIESAAETGLSKVPSEDELTTLLGVSRPTIRSALLSLQLEGKVRYERGRGRFVNTYVARMRSNLAEERDLVETLVRLGHSAASRAGPVTTRLPGAEIASRLLLGQDSRVCMAQRVVEADGTPVAISRDYLPVQHLARPVGDIRPGDSPRSFVSENTRHKVRYSVAEVVPTLASQTTVGVLGIAKGQPLLLLRYLHLDEREKPVALTETLVNDETLRFSVVRVGAVNGSR